MTVLSNGSRELPATTTRPAESPRAAKASAKSPTGAQVSTSISGEGRIELADLTENRREGERREAEQDDGGESAHGELLQLLF